MRWVLGCLVAIGLASPAVAADFDVPMPPGPPPNFEIASGPLSVGPATFTRWSGFYVGGQIGLSNGQADFSNSTQPLIAYALRETFLQEDVAPSTWPILGATGVRTASYGGFAGYNSQWQDLIVGMEANINRASFTLHAPVSSIARSVNDDAGNGYTINITGNGTFVGEDFATVRLRGGWVVGNFLPYGFFGLALGLANTSVSATVSGEQYTSGAVGSCSSTAPCYAFSFTNGVSQNNAVLYGIAAGGGVDFALTANIFLRAEFEWDQFKPPPGYFASLVTGRVGAGFKF